MAPWFLRALVVHETSDQVVLDLLRTCPQTLRKRIIHTCIVQKRHKVLDTLFLESITLNPVYAYKLLHACSAEIVEEYLPNTFKNDYKIRWLSLIRHYPTIYRAAVEKQFQTQPTNVWGRIWSKVHIDPKEKSWFQWVVDLHLSQAKNDKYCTDVYLYTHIAKYFTHCLPSMIKYYEILSETSVDSISTNVLHLKVPLNVWVEITRAVHNAIMRTTKSKERENVFMRKTSNVNAVINLRSFPEQLEWIDLIRELGYSTRYMEYLLSLVNHYAGQTVENKKYMQRLNVLVERLIEAGLDIKVMQSNYGFLDVIAKPSQILSLLSIQFNPSQIPIAQSYLTTLEKQFSRKDLEESEVSALIELHKQAYTRIADKNQIFKYLSYTSNFKNLNESARIIYKAAMSNDVYNILPYLHAFSREIIDEIVNKMPKITNFPKNLVHEMAPYLDIKRNRIFLEKETNKNNEDERVLSLKDLMKATMASEDPKEILKTMAFLLKKLHPDYIEHASGVLDCASPESLVTIFKEDEDSLKLMESYKEIFDRLSVAESFFYTPAYYYFQSFGTRVLEEALLSKRSDAYCDAALEFDKHVEWTSKLNNEGACYAAEDFTLSYLSRDISSITEEINLERFYNRAYETIQTLRTTHNDTLMDDSVLEYLCTVLGQNILTVPAFEKMYRAAIQRFELKALKDPEGHMITDDDSNRLVNLLTDLFFKRDKEKPIHPFYIEWIDYFVYKTTAASECLKAWMIIQFDKWNKNDELSYRQFKVDLAKQLLNISRSAIHIKFVYRQLYLYEQNLLVPFLTENDYYLGSFTPVKYDEPTISIWNRAVVNGDHAEYWKFKPNYKLQRLTPYQNSLVIAQYQSQLDNPNRSAMDIQKAIRNIGLNPSCELDLIEKLIKDPSRSKYLKQLFTAIPKSQDVDHALRILKSQEILEREDASKFAAYTLMPLLPYTDPKRIHETAIEFLTSPLQSMTAITIKKEMTRILMADINLETLDCIFGLLQTPKIHRDVAIEIIKGLFPLTLKDEYSQLIWDQFESLVLKTSNIEILIAFLSQGVSIYYPENIFEDPLLTNAPDYDLLPKAQTSTFVKRIVKPLITHPLEDIQVYATTKMLENVLDLMKNEMQNQVELSKSLEETIIILQEHMMRFLNILQEAPPNKIRLYQVRITYYMNLAIKLANRDKNDLLFAAMKQLCLKAKSGDIKGRTRYNVCIHDTLDMVHSIHSKDSRTWIWKTIHETDASWGPNILKSRVTSGGYHYDREDILQTMEDVFRAVVDYPFDFSVVGAEHLVHQLHSKTKLKKGELDFLFSQLIQKDHSNNTYASHPQYRYAHYFATLNIFTSTTYFKSHPKESLDFIMSIFTVDSPLKPLDLSSDEGIKIVQHQTKTLKQISNIGDAFEEEIWNSFLNERYPSHYFNFINHYFTKDFVSGMSDTRLNRILEFMLTKASAGLFSTSTLKEILRFIFGQKNNQVVSLPNRVLEHLLTLQKDDINSDVYFEVIDFVLHLSTEVISQCRVSDVMPFIYWKVAKLHPNVLSKNWISEADDLARTLGALFTPPKSKKNSVESIIEKASARSTLVDHLKDLMKGQYLTKKHTYMPKSLLEVPESFVDLFFKRTAFKILVSAGNRTAVKGKEFWNKEFYDYYVSLESHESSHVRTWTLSFHPEYMSETELKGKQGKKRK